MTADDVCSGDLFIFYGLLMKEAFRSSQVPGLDASGTVLGRGAFRGKMYDLGEYPGVIRGGGLCQGLIWKLLDTGIVSAIDAFEGYVAGSAHSLYVRERTDLLDDEGGFTGHRAWIYIYNQTTAGYEEIGRGVWSIGYEETGL